MMKDRRPRKRKKELKRKFEKVQALRTVQVAVITMEAGLQIAAIAAVPSRIPTDAALKGLRVAQTAIETQKSIAQVMNTGPKNWREALKKH